MPESIESSRQRDRHPSVSIDVRELTSTRERTHLSSMLWFRLSLMLTITSRGCMVLSSLHFEEVTLPHNGSPKKNESDLPSLTRRCSPCRARYHDESLTMAFSARHHAGRRRTKVSRSWTDARFQSCGRERRAHFGRSRKIEAQKDGRTVFLISPHSNRTRYEMNSYKFELSSHTRGASVAFFTLFEHD